MAAPKEVSDMRKMVCGRYKEQIKRALFRLLHLELVDEIETEGSGAWKAKDSEEKAVIPIMADEGQGTREAPFPLEGRNRTQIFPKYADKKRKVTTSPDELKCFPKTL